MRAEITRNMEKIMNATTASEKIHDMLLDEMSVLFDAHELSDDIYWNDVELTLEEIVEKLMAKCHSGNEDALKTGLHQIQAKETLMELIEDRELDYWKRHDDDEGVSEEMLNGMERCLETEIPGDFEWLLSTFGHIQSPNLVVMGLYRGEKSTWVLTWLLINWITSSNGKMGTYWIWI